MRLPRTLSIYAIREVLTYAGLGLAAISVVFVSHNLLRFLDELIGIGFDGETLLRMVGYLGAVLVSYTLPIAFLFGVMLAVARMASNTEITAMRSCGIGLLQIVAPVFALGFAVSCLTWYLQLEVDHAAERGLRVAIKQMAASSQMLEPGRFRRIGDRVLFVRGLDAARRLQGVAISDRSDPKRPMMIFAEAGEVDWDLEGGEVALRLLNGEIHVHPRDSDVDSYRRISFLSFDYAFGIDRVLGLDPGRVRPREMSGAQLRAVLARARAGDDLSDLRKQDPVEYELQLHRRVALPVAPMLFALVGVPLGMSSTRGARARGAMLCGVLAFVYYLILTFSQFLALERAIPSWLALWIPNAVFALAAVALLRRARLGA